jgi:hypothetical protein
MNSTFLSKRLKMLSLCIVYTVMFILSNMPVRALCALALSSTRVIAIHELKM